MRQVANVDGFETVTADFPAHEISNARLDELARWLVGRPSSFLHGAQSDRKSVV